MHASLVVVDSRVADLDQLLEGVGQSTQVLQISPAENGIGRIDQALWASPNSIDRLEILSHGQPGELWLGRDRLNVANLSQYQDALQSWGRSLTNTGEIILHGCQVGAGKLGRTFVDHLHRLTSRAIAAKTDITGGDRTGGNWTFDVLVGGASGRSGLSWRSRRAYRHTLATFFVTNPNDDGSGVTGTLSEAIQLANMAAGADTIVLQTDMTVTGVMKSLIDSDITITGDDPTTTGIVETRTISGGSTHRPLFIRSGTVTLQDLTVTDGLAQGGNGGSGGAGAGLVHCHSIDDSHNVGVAL